MDPVVHFEMPRKDAKRVSKFYRKAFGWKMKTLGGGMGSYVLATTTESDQKTGRPKSPGVINGGFFELDESKPGQVPSVVIGVKSIKESMKKVTQAGGKVLGKPMEIPGVGLYVSFYDTEGNRISLLQPKM